MKKIIKSREPHSLRQHKAATHSYYNNIPAPTKEELRRSLLEEQGYICCYCLKRIPEVMDGKYLMKIEHYKCQHENPDKQLDYKNLFGVCNGNEGNPANLQTCDTKKGASKELTIDLLTVTPDCDALFKYTANGQISSANKDKSIDCQLEEVLNLNMQTLQNSRRQIYLEVQRRIETESKSLSGQPVKLAYLQKEKQRWLSRDKKGKFRPFCMVAVYLLTKKIRQCESR